MEPVIIGKENISKLSFSYNDVLSNADEKHHRLEKLKTALVLGNGFKQKVRLIFRDVNLWWAVETTLWFVSDSHVTLKSGVTMPITCIQDVIL
jgi:hypothetical protein